MLLNWVLKQMTVTRHVSMDSGDATHMVKQAPFNMGLIKVSEDLLLMMI